MTVISRDEWLKALAEAGHAIEDDPSAITTEEFAQMLGVSWHTAMRRLRHLVERGQAIQTRRVATARNGRRQGFIAYRLIDANPNVKTKRKPS